eukprot:CAMPEP_0118673186 /NCGR_PEP_ID=MMETSP0800-20121206/181_1 /TAXON_ID=210618 ORGANISM="Striatella unipunctata, Strain CCMP2910" /NCGR_SAMPLE_ID=MMETSP0800 /ASSEMBLY_ACC=CAM_ASM_000638 /LENGTH=58 /DNA_ID=CAMNT_0006568219 /DNA_START=995 /DNA_END=1171 /DNA_ORIENTATION=+
MTSGSNSLDGLSPRNLVNLSYGTTWGGQSLGSSSSTDSSTHEMAGDGGRKRTYPISVT